MFIKEHANKYSVNKMANVLGVSSAGYYKFITKEECATKRKNKELLVQIKVISKSKRQLYGGPRIHRELIKQGETCSRKRVAKIMKENAIQAKIKKKWKATAKESKDLLRIAPNLLNQNFRVDNANRVWVTDITYVPTKEGWLY